MIEPETQSDINSDFSVRLAKIEAALKMLKDLHYCESVRAHGEQCAICAMWELLK